MRYKGFKPIPVKLTDHGMSLVNLSDNFIRACTSVTGLGYVFQLTPPDKAGNVKISTTEKGIVSAYVPECDVIPIEAEPFKPIRIQLTEHGKYLASASANFRAAIDDDHVFLLEPAGTAYSVRIGTSETGTVCMYVPYEDVLPV